MPGILFVFCDSVVMASALWNLFVRMSPSFRSCNMCLVSLDICNRNCYRFSAVWNKDHAFFFGVWSLNYIQQVFGKYLLKVKNKKMIAMTIVIANIEYLLCIRHSSRHFLVLTLLVLIKPPQVKCCFPHCRKNKLRQGKVQCLTKFIALRSGGAQVWTSVFSSHLRPFK